MKGDTTAIRTEQARKMSSQSEMLHQCHPQRHTKASCIRHIKPTNYLSNEVRATSVPLLYSTVPTQASSPVLQEAVLQFTPLQPVRAGGQQSWEERRADESGGNCANNLPGTAIALNSYPRRSTVLRHTGST